jgi:hypothetical protein
LSLRLRLRVTTVRVKDEGYTGGVRVTARV